MTQPSFTQVTFRIRNDNGNETTATWRQTQGTDDTLQVNTNYRIRFLIDETAARAWTNKVWNLYYSHNSGSYTAVGASQPVNYSASGNFAQGDDCTSQLTGGSGAFLTDNNGMCESSGATNSGAAGNYFEVEYCIQIDSTLVAHNDTIVLRVYDGTAAIATYTDSPTIMVSEPPIITMDTALLTAQKPAMDVQPGAVTKSLDTAFLSAASPIITVTALAASININLDTASSVLSAIPFSVVEGQATILFDTASMTITAVPLTVVEGTATVSLDTALLVLSGIQIGVSGGAPPTPITINLDTSTLTITFDSSLVLLYQILNPVQDTSLGSWTDQAGGVSNIYQSIDEDTPNDADYVKSPVLPAANTYKFKLESAGDPDIHLHHSITIRFRKPFNVGTTTLSIRLMEGVTQRASWSETVTTSWQTITEELSEAEAASITDYTNLYIELEAA